MIRGEIGDLPGNSVVRRIGRLLGYEKPAIAEMSPLGCSDGLAGRLGLVSPPISPRVAFSSFARVEVREGGLVVKKHVLSPCLAGGGLRGVVRGFSQASRSRMVRRLMAVAWSELLSGRHSQRVYSLFVTLTYPDIFSDAHERWKRDIDTFSKRLSRHIGSAAFLWKMELKTRKSGDNKGSVAPHFHLLCYFPNSIDIADFRGWLSLAWYEIVGSGDDKHFRAGTQAVRCYGSVGKLMAYMCKYLCKDFQTEIETGRCWGEVGQLPNGEIYTFDLDYVEFCRRVRRWGCASRFLRSVNCPSGFVVFGECVCLIRGLVVNGYHPPNMLYRETVISRTIDNVRGVLSARVERRIKNAEIISRILATYGQKTD